MDQKRLSHKFVFPLTDNVAWHAFGRKNAGTQSKMRYIATHLVFVCFVSLWETLQIKWLTVLYATTMLMILPCTTTIFLMALPSIHFNEFSFSRAAFSICATV